MWPGSGVGVGGAVPVGTGGCEHYDRRRQNNRDPESWCKEVEGPGASVWWVPRNSPAGPAGMQPGLWGARSEPRPRRVGRGWM